jgi:hypothetical protein
MSAACKKLSSSEMDDLALKLDFIGAVNEVINELAFSDRDSLDALPKGTLSVLTSEVRVKLDEVKDILNGKKEG